MGKRIHMNKTWTRFIVGQQPHKREISYCIPKLGSKSSVYLLRWKVSHENKTQANKKEMLSLTAWSEAELGLNGRSLQVGTSVSAACCLSDAVLATQS